ncbi:MAG TPA: DUF817 domain-containing protein [Propionibacteriaceae bacterium]|nr:DUF817 domain-containing protein [Propionibacteriaceae bacterium]
MPETKDPATLASVNGTTPATRRSGAAAAGARATAAWAQLLRFAWVQVQCCLFAVAVFVGLAASSLVPLPIARYDALLAYAVVLTAVFFLLRLETAREVAVIFAFHLVGLALEVFKVQVGSWSYPESAWTKVGGVPLYSGFMYAAVGSYICQAFRRLDLRVDRFPWPPAVALAAAAYANFFAHHYLPDLRWVIAAGFVLVLWRSWVFYTVGRHRYAMPLSLSFVLIGFFLWVAENAATLLGAWQYPDQEQVWQMVHVGKWGSWALLVSLSFVLVAAVKMQEGRFYGEVGAVAAVTGSLPRRPNWLLPRGDRTPPVRARSHAGVPLERRRERRLGPVTDLGGDSSQR